MSQWIMTVSTPFPPRPISTKNKIFLIAVFTKTCFYLKLFSCTQVTIINMFDSHVHLQHSTCFYCNSFFFFCLIFVQVNKTILLYYLYILKTKQNAWNIIIELDFWTSFKVTYLNLAKISILNVVYYYYYYKY